MYSFFFSKGSAGNVRGKQPASWLNAKLNPKSGFENDICIYVKVLPPDNYPKHTYFDVDDSVKAVEWLKTHTDTGVIVNSSMSRDYLSKLLKRDDIVVIPHAHCNWENWVRPDREVKTVGIIGSKTSFRYPIDDIREKLNKLGLELIYNYDYWKSYGDEDGMSEDQRRQKVVNFYKSIDIQIAWRKHAFRSDFIPLKNANKLINAGSFGIPTVAYPEESYTREWKGLFIPTQTIEELLFWVSELKTEKDLYKVMSRLVLKKASECHVNNIKKLYLNL